MDICDSGSPREPPSGPALEPFLAAILVSSTVYTYLMVMCRANAAFRLQLYPAYGGAVGGYMHMSVGISRSAREEKEQDIKMALRELSSEKLRLGGKKIFPRSCRHVVLAGQSGA